MAIHHYLEANGCEVWPAKQDLRRFRNIAGVSISNFERPWPEVIEEARRYREQLGLPCPDRVRPRGASPQIKAPSDPIPGAVPPVLPGSVTKERCIEAIRIYLDEIRPGTNPTQKGYGRAATGRPEMPAHRNFRQYGGWRQLLKEARSNEESPSS